MPEMTIFGSREPQALGIIVSCLRRFGDEVEGKESGGWKKREGQLRTRNLKSEGKLKHEIHNEENAIVSNFEMMISFGFRM